MYKALLKKQMLEFASMWLKDRKTGKMRSGSALTGFIVLLILVFGFLAFAFVGIGELLAHSFLPVGLDWLYFAMMGLIALVLGVFGDVFNSFASLYLAKDNELLLSLPVTPSAILFVRMISVYLMGFIYEAVVFLPASVVYWIETDVITLPKVLFPLIFLFLIGIVVLVLTCVLGYGVAQISKRIKGKTFVTVLASLGFIAIYYFFYFRFNAFLQNIASNGDIVGQKIKGRAYPVYVFGMACAGDVKSLLIVLAAVILLLAITYFVLSKTFIGITTASGKTKKAGLKEKDLTARASGIPAALLQREFKHLASSATYMMNCGLGLIILLALGVAALIKADYIREVLGTIIEQMPAISRLTAGVPVLLVGLVLSMNQFTAPSISLEGKNLWILQSLPVNAADVLRAKERMHLLLNILPAIIGFVLINIALGTNAAEAAAAFLPVAAFMVFTANLGLLLDLRNPNLVWTNENVPVKQNTSVLFAMLFSFLANVLFGAACWFGTMILPLWSICLMFAALLCGITLAMRKNIFTKGAEKFASL